MSHKDYIALAAAFADARRQILRAKLGDAAMLGRDVALELVANACKRDNGAFDYGRFMRAADEEKP